MLDQSIMLCLITSTIISKVETTCKQF